MTFQRARRPEQLAARRSAILTSAREMLAEKAVADISLRELSDRIGLAKSNVLRYFDSREAIFLEILDEEFAGWLADLEAGLGRPRARKPNYANEIRVATMIADSLEGRQSLCELVASMAVVLERNISYDFARDFKARATARIAELAQLVATHLPWLPRDFADFFAEGALTLLAGMYPFSVPTEPVRAAIAELGITEPEQRFRDGLRIGLSTWLIGAAAQTGA
ncbi:AcrR family transcriptional regulator [Mycobacterium sp. OAS707]|uniref:TetR family transcriptional regulator n=1 Tax=Mycobacterium sp. OAS707 TaxID=2663822 RepID=UPI001A06C86A|nr:AcrR family transcriptional regulator [Mycobacterium sp. OAS707]